MLTQKKIFQIPNNINDFLNHGQFNNHNICKIFGDLFYKNKNYFMADFFYSKACSLVDEFDEEYIFYLVVRTRTLKKLKKYIQCIELLSKLIRLCRKMKTYRKKRLDYLIKEINKVYKLNSK
jgi:tetratricopeptide (TPR) repeat protein